VLVDFFVKVIKRAIFFVLIVLSVRLSEDTNPVIPRL